MNSKLKPNLSLLISKFLLPISSIEAFENYLRFIFLPLSIIKAENREVIIPFSIFHKLMQMPLIFSKQLFEVIKGKHQDLDLKNFTKGLTLLYLGTIDQQLSLLFSICDFNQNGRIEQEDLELIFKHFHYNDYRKTNDKDENSFNIIQEIISSTFNGNLSLNINELKERLLINSDLIMLLIIFINIHRPFIEDNIFLAYNSLSSHNKNDNKDDCNKNEWNSNDNLEQLRESTEDLFDYINTRFRESLDYSCSRTSINSIKELDQFEEDLTDVMTNASSKDDYMTYVGLRDSEDKDNLRESGDNSMSKIDSFWCLPKKQLSSFKLKLVSVPAITNTNSLPQSSQNTKNNSKLSLNLSKQLSLSSPSIHHPQAKIIQGSMAIKGKIQVVSIMLLNKDLFIYSNSNALLKIIHMNNYLITIEQQGSDSGRYNSNTDNPNKVLISIIPRYSRYLTSNQILCKEHESVSSFIKEIKHTVNQRNVEDHYSFGEKIWNGDNSMIFKGRSINKINKEAVAIKVISKKSLDKSILEMIETEIEVYRLLKIFPNENIINAIDLFESDNYYFIINEYLADGTLTQYLKRKPIIFQKLFTIFINQILKSIQFLHSFGIVHRDIKTDNILLSRNRNNDIVLKLNDFGLSKIIGFTESATESCGSLSYTAPEILLKQPYSHQVDIWSIGVLSFFIWYRQFPFSDANNDMEEIAIKIKNGDYVFPQFQACYFQKDNDSIKQFINSCLTVNSTLRSKIEDLLNVVYN